MVDRGLLASCRFVLRLRASIVRAVGVLSLLFGGFHLATAQETDRGFELYMAECSMCHGSMGLAGSADDRRRLVQLAFTGQAAEGLCVGDRFIGSARRDSCKQSTPQFAFALPFGPNLSGIVGSKAGTVEGYEYSKAFMEVFEGTVWDEAALDTYIADSQLRAPGIRMYYRQPDGEIRRLIIDFLKTRP